MLVHLLKRKILTRNDNKQPTTVFPVTQAVNLFQENVHGIASLVILSFVICVQWIWLIYVRSRSILMFAKNYCISNGQEKLTRIQPSFCCLILIFSGFSFASTFASSARMRRGRTNVCTNYLFAPLYVRIKGLTLFLPIFIFFQISRVQTVGFRRKIEMRCATPVVVQVVEFIVSSGWMNSTFFLFSRCLRLSPSHQIIRPYF